MKVFCGSANKKLTEKIISEYNFKFQDDNNPLKLGNLSIDKFSDGEILPRFNESVRYEDVMIIQSTTSSDNIMETLLIIDAAKRADCKSITLISPFMGYSRQDKTDHLRSSIGSKVLADVLEKVGVNRLVTIDLHSSSIQACYNIHVTHLLSSKIFSSYIKNEYENYDNVSIVSPDRGAIGRNSTLVKILPKSTLALIDKRRVRPNEIHSMELVGDVRGKHVIMSDDICDTAGTLCKAANLLMDNGALSVKAFVTHGVLSGNAINNINNSKLSELVVSDTIETVFDKQKLSDKIKIVSCADILSDVIYRFSHKKSINEVNIL